MAQFKEVELVNGTTVNVYRVPDRRVYAIVEKQHPKPLPPIRSDKTATGRTITMQIDDDPEYLQALAQWEETANNEVEKVGALFTFKDLQVPKKWDVEAEYGTEARYFDPEWAPREGEMGRKLDYIEWEILGDAVNALRVIRAREELSGIDMAEVNANEASFRGQVEGPTD